MVKHADGMRGPTQAASMVEEVTSREEDPCEKFGAKKKSWQSNTCQCPEKLPVPIKCASISGSTFNLTETIEAGSKCRCDSICDEFGAEDWGTDLCRCPKERAFRTVECGGSRSSMIFPSAPSPGCRCLTDVEYTKLMTIPVSASALRFCSALAEQEFLENSDHDDSNPSSKVLWEHGEMNSRNMESAMHRTLEETSPQICQHALTGTINETETKRAPFAEKASKLSQHGSDEDEDGEYGRMRAVKEDATPGQQLLWKQSLAQVCKDECDYLLEMMKNESEHLAQDVMQGQVPFAQACAERVVQQVEAEVLGCCGRSCGFDGYRCLLWPFFSPQEKVDWQLECCAEMSILKNSSRELMCNSVLSSGLAKEASEYDLGEQNGTDVGKVLIGQNSSLVWTRQGIKFQFPKKSKARRFISKLFNPFGKEKKAEATPHEGDKVSMEFLIQHPKIGEEYLHLGYFKEEPITKILNEATSLMEVSSQDDTCNFGKFKEKCPKEWMDTYTNRCKEAWLVAGEHKEFGNLKEQVEDPVFGNCYVNDHKDVAAPEDCKKIATNRLNQKIFLHYFEYNNENSKKPIKCFTLSKEQCEGRPGWWTKIPLKSVQDVIKQEEITNYTYLVYVKLKAD